MMTQEEKLEYSKKKAIAVYPMCNWGGLEILDILYDIDTYVVCRYFGLDYHKLKVNYNKDGSAYFRLGTWRIRLDECVRVQIWKEKQNFTYIQI